jgi:hypothetical protein
LDRLLIACGSDSIIVLPRDIHEHQYVDRSNFRKSGAHENRRRVTRQLTTGARKSEVSRHQDMEMTGWSSRAGMPTEMRGVTKCGLKSATSNAHPGMALRFPLFLATHAAVPARRTN